MEKPFLDPQSKKYLDHRFEEVASAVEVYLKYRDDKTGAISEVEKPEPLDELEHFEYMGWQHLPVSGGLYDQPFFFMHDIWAAIAGKTKYTVERQEQQAERSILFEEKNKGKIDLNNYFNISE